MAKSQSALDQIFTLLGNLTGNEQPQQPQGMLFHQPNGTSVRMDTKGNLVGPQPPQVQGPFNTPGAVGGQPQLPMQSGPGTVGPMQQSGLPGGQPQQNRPTLTPDMVKNAILQWSKGDATVPILKYVNELAQAGNMMPSHVDPWLPIVMALRETQGGRDLTKPGTISGQNDIFNIKNTAGQPGNTGTFMNYPDVKTSILGGTNNGQQSGGFVGQINNTVPTQADNYAQFRQSGNLSDLFSKWSPSGGTNGPITGQNLPGDQIYNYYAIKQQMGLPNQTLGLTSQTGGGSPADTNRVSQAGTNTFPIANASQ